MKFCLQPFTEDIETNMPGLIGATIDWFRYYEMPNKPPCEFAFDESKEFAIDIIKTLHDQWMEMMEQKDDPTEISRHCTIFNGYMKINQGSVTNLKQLRIKVRYLPKNCGLNLKIPREANVCHKIG